MTISKPQSKADRNGSSYSTTSDPTNGLMRSNAVMWRSYRGVPQTPRSESSPLRWFYDLSVRHKQLLALLASEVISILGFVGVGALLIVAGGRAQLLNQAKAELAVMDIEYDLKINQMKFGFRGQSENAAIISLSQDYTEADEVDTELQSQVERILANEVKARQIEYATLVGPDLRIIASANADRTGDQFDPNGLVGELLANPRSFQTSAIVPWSDLQQEQPPLPEGVANQDALIRYTFTPVRDPDTNAMLAVLVSGDIVNGKPDIVERTVTAFDNGYSAVYLRQPSGSYELATSFDLGNANSLDAGQRDVPLTDTSLLEAASALGGQPIARRMQIGDQTYTVAATAITDFNRQPVAILVRGTSEQALNDTLRQNLTTQLILAAIALVADVLLAALLGRSIASPIQHLRRVNQRFSQGDRSARAEVFSTDEVGQLAQAFNDLAANITASEETLQAEYLRQQLATERARQLTAVTSMIRQSLDRERVFRVAVKEIRDVLVADRVIVYLFDPSWKGKVVAESVGAEWTPSLNVAMDDPCFVEKYVEQYRQGRVNATANIYEAGYTDCYIQQLAVFEVQANLVAPILVEDRLIGLLIAHQCAAPRDWQDFDILFCRQAAVQLGFALEQADLFTQRDEARLAAEALSDERNREKEIMQQQLMTLLGEVEGAARGNLTVRAEITAGEIGVVADFFNSIVESLRQIVTKVQQAALQVNTSLSDNEQAIGQLANEALRQVQDISTTLTSVERMTHSIQAVAASAQEAAQVARKASETAEAGGAAMDLTVQNILSLRETVGETAKRVKRLGESSQQISKVVSLINQLAVQTNLLAINAGIEAARAGEEGQGFAVVADEVRDLAGRSAAATQEIEKIVGNIQRETSQVVEAMEESTAQVVEGTLRVEDAKRNLSQILEVSRQIDQLVQSISAATVPQVETARAVSHLMERLVNESERTSTASRQVIGSLQQTVGVAKELQSAVKEFEVDAPA